MMLVRTWNGKVRIEDNMTLGVVVVVGRSTPIGSLLS
jgi:hypothetical protein